MNIDAGLRRLLCQLNALQRPPVIAVGSIIDGYLGDTDKGRELLSQITELQHLLYAYRHGILKERTRQ